jgi:hypothetical protein
VNLAILGPCRALILDMWKDKNGQNRGWNLRGEHKVILSGAALPQWKGDDASVEAGRMRARARYKIIDRCTHCGKPATDRHHVDGNTLNNEPENVAPLCRRCHMALDGRLDALRVLAVDNARRKALLPPKRCVVCSVPSNPLTKGRCKACLMYFRRTGRERPPEFFGRTYPPRDVLAAQRAAKQDRSCPACGLRWGNHSNVEKSRCCAAMARAAKNVKHAAEVDADE